MANVPGRNIWKSDEGLFDQGPLEGINRVMSQWRYGMWPEEKSAAEQAGQIPGLLPPSALSSNKAFNYNDRASSAYLFGKQHPLLSTVAQPAANAFQGALGSIMPEKEGYDPTLSAIGDLYAQFGRRAANPTPTQQNRVTNTQGLPNPVQPTRLNLNPNEPQETVEGFGQVPMLPEVTANQGAPITLPISHTGFSGLIPSPTRRGNINVNMPSLTEQRRPTQYQRTVAQQNDAFDRFLGNVGGGTPSMPNQARNSAFDNRMWGGSNIGDDERWGARGGTLGGGSGGGGRNRWGENAYAF